VNVEIRQHAKNAIIDSNFKDEIHLIEGSSVEDKVVNQVKTMFHNTKRLWSY
jgi:hypothetical protein